MSNNFIFEEFPILEIESQSEIVGSNGSECENIQVNNPYESLTDKELVELRGDLEVDLFYLGREERGFVIEEDRTPYDIKVDIDYTLYKIEEVEKCLKQRNLDWLSV